MNDAAGRGSGVRRRLRNAWHAINGLVTIPDVLSKVGFWLYRGTLRRTSGVAMAMGAVVLLGKKTDAFDLTLRQAASGTGAILLISFVGGLMLMLISGSFARSQLTLGEAKGSNLLEEMKKSRSRHHCRRFWNHVFGYEQVHYSAQDMAAEALLIQEHRRDLDDLCHPNTRRALTGAQRKALLQTMNELGRTRQGWDLLFDYVCQVPLPRSVLRQTLRYDLSKIKDWYDGAPFHHTDTKLQEQFDAAEHIQAAKAEAGLDWFFLLTHTRRRLLQSMWFKMITRAIQLRVARACQTLDARYPTCHFAPDQFLWPSQVTHDIVRQAAGEEALAELIDYRRKIFHRVLSPEPELAQSLMQRAIYPNFEAAAQLRRLYDPQYVLGELKETWQSDLRHYNRAFRPIEKREARRQLYTRQVKEQQKALAAFLASHPVDGADEPEARRAVRIAMHVDRDGLRRMICDDGANDVDAIKAVVAQAVAEKQPYTRKLLAVRSHHELARLELEDYEYYLNRILH